MSVPKDNIYASIMAVHYSNWLHSHLSDDGLLDTFDGKALVAPRSFFFQNGSFIGFDTRLTNGSEDIELGQRWVSEGKVIRYDPTISIYHTERTTLISFVRQHFRIARAEAFLTHASIHGRVDMFPGKKTYLNAVSFLRKERQFLTTLKFKNAVYLPFLYGLLFIIRLVGYSIGFLKR